VLVLFFLLFIGGCGPCQPENLCPKFFKVHTWCNESRKCTLEGGAVDCYSGGCTIPVGKTLQVPVGEFASQLGSRRELQFHFFFTVLPADFSLVKLTATLDGAVASSLPLQEHNRIAVHWEPFPSQPMSLEVRHSHPVLAEAQIEIDFHDYPCRQQHPPKVCAR
jgi:hypothetical protein